MFLWIASLEDGAIFDNEHFLPTYGQLLAIFVAVPPLLQLIVMLPGLWPWFKDLAWVRFLTCRPPGESSESSGEQSSENPVKEPLESAIQQSPDISTEPQLSYGPRPQGMDQQYSSYVSSRSQKTFEEKEKTTEAPSASHMV